MAISERLKNAARHPLQAIRHATGVFMASCATLRKKIGHYLVVGEDYLVAAIRSLGRAIRSGRNHGSAALRGFVASVIVLVLFLLLPASVMLALSIQLAAAPWLTLLVSVAVFVMVTDIVTCMLAICEEAVIVFPEQLSIAELTRTLTETDRFADVSSAVEEFYCQGNTVPSA